MEKEAFLPAAYTADPETERSSFSAGYWEETWRLLLLDPVARVMLFLLAAMILGAVVIPVVWPVDYAAQSVTFANRSFFSRDPATGIFHLLGTDHLGRDIFIRVFKGARISLLVAVAVAVIDCVAGVAYGSFSGYRGGMTDNVMMRALEIISGIPYMMIVLLLMATLPQGIGTIIFAYSLVGWTGTARLVRGQVLSLKNQEFVIAARIMGASTKRILLFHILPNLAGILVVNVTLDIPSIIFTEAFLSMLGLGVPPPHASLGVMANEGIRAFQVYPWQLFIPALFICLLMLSFHLLGDRLQDVLNPRLRKAVGYGINSKRKKPEHIL